MNADQDWEQASRVIVIELHDAMWDDSHAAPRNENATDTGRAKDSLIAPGTLTPLGPPNLPLRLPHSWPTLMMSFSSGGARALHTEPLAGRLKYEETLTPGTCETPVHSEAAVAGAERAKSKTTSYKAGLVALRKMGWTIYLSTPNFGQQIKGFHEALSKLLRAQGIAFGRHSLVRNLLVISIAAPDNRAAITPEARSPLLPPQTRYTETLKVSLRWAANSRALTCRESSRRLGRRCTSALPPRCCMTLAPRWSLSESN